MKIKIERFNRHQFKNGSVTCNRIIVPPMASGTAGANGVATDATVAHYATLAQSGAGIVMVEYTYVHASGKSEERQLGVDRDDQIERLSEVAQSIKKTGALAAIQITHSGGKNTMELTENELMAPSAVAIPVKGQEM